MNESTNQQIIDLLEATISLSGGVGTVVFPVAIAVRMLQLARAGVTREPLIEMFPKPTHDVVISYGTQHCEDCAKALHERDGHYCSTDGKWK